MKIRDTSIDAYQELQEHLDTHEKIVLQTIQKYPRVSDNEIQRITKLRINDITGRRNELEKQGKIKAVGKKTDRLTNRRVYCWTTA